MDGERPDFQASTRNTDLTYRVFTVVRHQKECDLEELIQGCSSYPSDEVFKEIIRLAHTGDLRLIYKKDGEYAFRLKSSNH